MSIWFGLMATLLFIVVVLSVDKSSRKKSDN